MEKKQFYSVREVAEYFDVSPDLIRKLCEQGEVPGARRLGNIWRIPAKFLENNSTIDEEQTNQDDNQKD